MYERERQNRFLLPLKNPVMGKENAGNEVFKSYTSTLNLGLSFISLYNHQMDLVVYCIYEYGTYIFPEFGSGCSTTWFKLCCRTGPLKL